MRCSNAGVAEHAYHGLTRTGADASPYSLIVTMFCIETFALVDAAMRAPQVD